jgi:hypothetical protein
VFDHGLDLIPEDQLTPSQLEIFNQLPK